MQSALAEIAQRSRRDVQVTHSPRWYNVNRNVNRNLNRESIAGQPTLRKQIFDVALGVAPSGFIRGHIGEGGLFERHVFDPAGLIGARSGSRFEDWARSALICTRALRAAARASASITSGNLP
jgi:hypothetical protein